MTIVIACDGSCIQQGDFRKGDATDRSGAAGFVADVDGTLVGQAEPFANGTIGAMEVRALLMGLKFASALREQRTDLDRVPIEIVCDSRYAVQGYNEWLTGWAANGYNKKGGLANADDWRAINELKVTLGKAVEVTWTKGHSNGHTRHTQMNRRVDELVNGAARSQRSKDDTHHLLCVKHSTNPSEEMLQTPADVMIVAVNPVEQLEEDMRRYLYDRDAHRRIISLTKFQERMGYKPWAERKAEAVERSDGMSVERQTQSRAESWRKPLRS